MVDTISAMSRVDELRQAVDALAVEHGLGAIGVAGADPFFDVATEVRSRVADGLHGGLRFTFADPDTSTDVRRSFPWADRLVVASRPYLPEAGTPLPEPGHGVVARFAVEDPYAPLRTALEAIAARLVACGHRAEILIDDNRLVDRAAAVRAGIAWWGKSSMVLDPRHGPWIVLGSVVTDAPLPVDEPMVRGCGTCEACIPACPTGAIIAPGVLDAGRCLAAAAQMGGSIPAWQRPLMGDRLYGCDDCLTACPPGFQLLDAAEEPRGAVDLVELLSTADEPLRARYDHFYLAKDDPDVLRRNALVVLGNQARPEHLGLLGGYLAHPNPVLRGHAAWALGRCGGVVAAGLLEAAIAEEADADVRAELQAALQATHASG